VANGIGSHDRPDGSGSGPADEPDDGPIAARAVDVVVGALLALAILAGASLLVVYALGGQVQAEGVLLATLLGCIAIAVGMWARHFMPQGPVEQERPVLESSTEQRAAVAAEFDRGERTVLNRRVLLSLLVGAFGTVGAVALFPIRSLGPDVLPDLRRTSWRRGARLVDETGQPVRRDALDVDGVMTVFPEGVTTEQARADSQTLLLRTGPGVLRPRPGRAGWSPDGYVAFSKVCTHAGCPVGLYQQASHQLVCPCHQSVFDVTDAATPVFGPATRPLPQLPLRIEDGYLVADGDFGEPIGPEFWSWGRR
jgi:ubiquinol-cytochrome c reductase iron-sulfur subunit